MERAARRQMAEKDGERGVRLNRYLSAAGICSRREADRRIAAGDVTIDGVRAGLGDKVLPGQRVQVGNRDIVSKDEPVLLAYYKPIGVVCTSSPGEKDNIIDKIHYPSRIYPIGRLDKDSEGLILLTNQGDLAERLSHARYCHEKEYLVRVDHPVTDTFLRHMREGVPILGTVTRPCRVTQIGKYSFSIILTQGLNRQIRRMCEAMGCRVCALKRIRILNIRLRNLKSGEYRKITGEELHELLRQLGEKGE